MGPRAPARTALLDYQNLGGWDSMGLAALIGMVTPLNVLIGYDCSVHMCRFQTHPDSLEIQAVANEPNL